MKKTAIYVIPLAIAGMAGLMVWKNAHQTPVSPASETRSGTRSDPSSIVDVPPDMTASERSMAQESANAKGVSKASTGASPEQPPSGPAEPDPAKPLYVGHDVGKAKDEAPSSPIAVLLAGAELLAEQESTLPGSYRHVRIVRSSRNKYPLLRVTVAEPQHLVVVADHLIVRKRPELSSDDFVAELKKAGYGIRKKMLAPETWLVAFNDLTPAELIPAYDKALMELKAYGRAEPDYVVEALRTPNDTYQHLLWGMHNTAARVTIASGASAGAIYNEGGKMAYAGELPAQGLTNQVALCGLGRSSDFPDVAGKIALIARGDITFAEKALHARKAGAVAVLIYNNAAGGFSGTLSTFTDAEGQPWLPVIPLSQSAGQALESAIAAAIPSPLDLALSALPSGKDIAARQAWETCTDSSAVLVGVIDTGIDYTHPDLTANCWVNPGESGLDAQGRDKTSNGVDDDDNGFIDDVHGWDFCNDDNDPIDDNNHGTHCAGTIGGVGDNGLGVVGVNWNVRMAAIKFLSAGGSGMLSDSIDCVYYANRIGVDLTSNSWGGGDATETMHDAIEAAHALGVLFIAAAGNSAVAVPMYPASYDNDNVISVAATDSADQMASFSNYGVPHVDLGAPGVNILSTVPMLRNPPYAFFSGTSMACPHVAGAAALLKGRVPSMAHLDLKKRLLDMADPIPALTGRCITGGRLNLARAMNGLHEEAFIELGGMRVYDDQPGGNNDGVANPGETMTLLFSLRNLGYQAASNVTATFSTSDAYVTLTDADCTFGLVAGRTEREASDVVALTISPDTPNPYSIKAMLTVDDQSNGVWELPVSLRISRTYRLSGIVNLDAGPLSNAVVRFSGTTSGEMVCDAAGLFDIAVPVGDYALQASYRDLELSKTAVQSFNTSGDPVTGSHSNIVFALRRAVVSGTVVDHANGVPVEGATITFLGPLTETLSSDADGTFRLDRIYGREVTWSVFAAKPQAYDYPTSGRTVTVPPDTHDLVFRLGWPAIELNLDGHAGFEVTLAPGESTVRGLNVTNIGVADLYWQADGLANGGGTAGVVRVEFNPPSMIADLPTWSIEGTVYAGEHLFWLESGVLYRQDKTGTLVDSEYLPETIVGFESSWRLVCFDGRLFWFEQSIRDADNPDHDFINLQGVDLATHQIVETLEVDRRLHISLSSNEIAYWGNARCCAFAEGVFLFYWAYRDPLDSKRYLHLARIDRVNGRLLSHFRLPTPVNWPHTNVSFTDFSYFNGALWMLQSQLNYGLGGYYTNIYQLDPADGAMLQVISPTNTVQGCELREIMIDETGALWVVKGYPRPYKVYCIDSGIRLWMRVDQQVGRLEAGGEQALALTFDAAGMKEGVYHGALRITSNDPNQPEVFIPLVLNVTASAGGNQSPVISGATPDTPCLLNEDTTQIFSVIVMDPDSDPLSMTWAMDGVVQTASGSNFTFHADFFSQGAHSLAVCAADGRGGVATRMWQIQVANSNRPPCAEDADLTVANCDTLDFSLQAMDPDMEPLTWKLLSQPTVGDLSGDPPELSYRPPSNFTGLVVFHYKVNDGRTDSNTGTVQITVGYRDIDADLTPLTVSAAFGEKATRTIILHNTGSTPLRWTSPQLPDDLPISAGTTLQTIGPLDVPTSHRFMSALSGLAYDGTNVLVAATELTPNNAYYRAHLLRYDPTTGQRIGTSLPAPTTSSFDYMWFTQMGWYENDLWAHNKSWVSDSSSRIMSFKLGTSELLRQDYIPIIENDFGSYIAGITRWHHGLWIFTMETSQNSVSGLVRIEPGTVHALDWFSKPLPSGYGPLAGGNGALWIGDYYGKRLTKINPFNGAVLEQRACMNFFQAQDLAHDHACSLFYKESDNLIHRVHTGDYAFMQPDGGVQSGGGQAPITVTFDSVMAGAGVHSGHILLLSDDPDEPRLQIPYTFTVGPAVGNTPPVIEDFSPAAMTTNLLTRRHAAFSVSATDSDPLTYRWFVDGRRNIRQDGVSAIELMPAPGAPGLHTLRVDVDDTRGGVTSLTWQLVFSDEPFCVQAIADLDHGPAPLSVRFGSLVNGGADTNGAFAAEQTMVVVEAEHYHRCTFGEAGGNIAWYPMGDDWLGSMNGAIYTESAFAPSPFSWTNTADAQYDIQFPASATYYLWMRTRPERTDQNACMVGLDNRQVGGVFDDDDNAMFNEWHWVQHTTPFNIGAGPHIFNLRAREKDYAVDRFLFTTDPNSTPQQLGPLWESARLPAVTYAWSFGDSVTNATASPEHSYTNTGVFLVQLVAYADTASATGGLSIVVHLTYADWCARFLASCPVEEHDPVANPDSDPYPNLIEYALDMDPLLYNPTNGIQVEMVHTNQDAFLALRFRQPRDRGDLLYLVEVNNDLLTNDWAANRDGPDVTALFSAKPEGSALVVLERNLVPAQLAPRCFMRLRIVLTP